MSPMAFRAGRRMLRRLALVTTTLLGGALTASPSVGQAHDLAAELRRDIAELRREYDRRLAELEARLARLEASAGESREAPAAPRDEQAALRAAAEAAAEEAPEMARPPTVVPEATVGRERNLNRLNPEISFTGDLFLTASDQGREEFELREVEVSLQTALDPFTYTKVFLAFGPEGEVEIEEGYATYTALAPGLQLSGGKLRQSFGVLNRWHRHALPQSDYPLPLTTYFGEEGLAQTGVSVDWLLPRPWATVNELTLQVTDGENDAFGGESFERFAALAHLKNYWELGPASYFEWGLSGIVGETETGGTSQVWGSDLTYRWHPPGRAKYRELTWRSELLLSRRDDETGQRQRAWGAYTYLEGLLARNWYAGLRYDRAEDPLAPDRVRWGITPYLTWWQSEYVRLRAEYGLLRDRAADRSENRFSLQLTWAAGPHKHEEY